MPHPSDLRKKHRDSLRNLHERDLIDMAAKRLLTDYRNGNLSAVRSHLETIGGAQSRDIVANMLQMLRLTEEFTSLCDLLHAAATAAPKLSINRQRVLRNLAMDHLDEIEP